MIGTVQTLQKVIASIHSMGRARGELPRRPSVCNLSLGKQGTLMTKSELIARVAGANPHLRFAEVERAVGTIFLEIAETLARGDRVELRSFGSFSTTTRKARIGRNPRTGEAVLVKEKRLPQFKAGKGMRLRLNRSV